jgi:protein TonB
MWSRQAESFSTVRTIIVPHGITAVQRRSPIKTRKRTPWRDSHGVVERGGSREWFTDRLFVESKQANLPGACSTSATVHAVVIGLVVLLVAARAAQPALMPHSVTDVSLQMPPLELLLVAITPPPTRKVVARPLPVTPPPPPMPARTLDVPAAAPLETPSAIEAEPMTLDDAPVEAAPAGAETGGATDGVTGGAAGGTGNALPVQPAEPPATTGPFRVGEGIAPPRKIKHVKPVYPVMAMSARVGGNVLVEATIGVDGKVHNARVLQSIAVLDQAALDAVRQWEFEPSRVDGEPVSVMMVIVVTFALL